MDALLAEVLVGESAVAKENWLVTSTVEVKECWMDVISEHAKEN